MTLEQIFYTIGIAYFGLWLLITIIFITLIVTLMIKMRKAVKQIEEDLGPAQIVLDLAKSSFVRKAFLFIGSLSFVSKTISNLLSKQDKNS